LRARPLDDTDCVLPEREELIDVAVNIDIADIVDSMDNSPDITGRNKLIAATSLFFFLFFNPRGRPPFFRGGGRGGGGEGRQPVLSLVLVMVLILLLPVLFLSA